MSDFADFNATNRRALLTGGMGAVLATQLPLAMAAAARMSGGAATDTFPLATIHGEFQSRSPAGAVAVGSRWWLTVNPDGSRNAYSIARSTRGDVVRQAMQSVSKDWVPQFGQCVLIRDGKTAGVITKYLMGDRIKSVFVTGDIFDVKEFPAPPRVSLGFHVGVGDAWHMSGVALKRGIRQSIAIHTSSATWNAVTLNHGETLSDGAEYLGEEDTEVGGLPLRCRTYLWFTSFGRTIKVWSYGEHNILARMEVLKVPEGFTPGTVYSLKSLQFLEWGA